MAGIDDSLEAIERQYEEKKDPVLTKMLQVAAELEPFGILNSLKILFSKDSTNQRFEAFIQQLVLEVRQLDKAGRLLREKVESPEFQETIIAGMNETARTIDREKVKRFALIIGSTLDSDKEAKSWDEAATFIKDIAQLGDDDIQALNILHSVFNSSVILADPDAYTSAVPIINKMIERNNINKDDFYSRCARLSGFGLVIEVQRNDSRMRPGDYCFRPTGRGLRLISFITPCG